MELTEQDKDYLRLAMSAHDYCGHEDSSFCSMLILAELALRRGRPITTDEEINACGYFIADEVLTSLILKGVVEVVGVSEEGDFELGLTEAGLKTYERSKDEDE